MRNLLQIAILLVALTSFSQERVNDPKLNIEKIGTVLTDAKGWSFDEHKAEWISTEKRKGINQCGAENFHNLFFTKIIYNEQKYYIFNINTIKEAFKYPTIKRGSFNQYEIRSYIFDETEFNELKNYKNAMPKFDEITTTTQSSTINEKVLDILRDKIVNKLKNKKYGVQSISTFKVQKEEGALVRFILPTQDQHKKRESQRGFDKNYFEVDQKDFDKMFE